MTRKYKTAKQMERHFKGIANHHRIDILLLVESNPGITVWNIADALEANRKTISQHTRYLVHAGLVTKRYKGRNVEHDLSPYGRIFTRFIQTFKAIPQKAL